MGLPKTIMKRLILISDLTSEPNIRFFSISHLPTDREIRYSCNINMEVI